MSDLSTIVRTASDLSTIQFRLIFKGRKSLEYWCLVIHLTSVSTISYAESNGVTVSLSSQNIKQRSQTYKLAICEGCCFHAKFLVKLFNFPEFPSKCRVIYG